MTWFNLEFYYLYDSGIEVVNRTIRTRAQENAMGLKVYFKRQNNKK
jgi:hypothetical protein